jgi:excisionase family DNA binding protein
MTSAEIRTQIKLLVDARDTISRSIASLEKQLQGVVATCSVTEACRLYGFKKPTIYKWIRKGKISYTTNPVKGYLLNMSELESLTK